MPTCNARKHLGAFPSEEQGARAGIDSPQKTRAQAVRLCRQLQRTFAIPAAVHAVYRVAAAPQDAAAGHEVVLDYDASDEQASQYAARVAAQLPTHWDGAAKADASICDTIEEAELAHARGEIDADTLWRLKFDSLARQDDAVLANWLSARLAALRRMSAEPGYTPPTPFAMRWRQALALMQQQAQSDLVNA